MNRKLQMTNTGNKNGNIVAKSSLDVKLHSSASYPHFSCFDQWFNWYLLNFCFIGWYKKIKATKPLIWKNRIKMQQEDNTRLA